MPRYATSQSWPVLLGATGMLYARLHVAAKPVRIGYEWTAGHHEGRLLAKDRTGWALTKRRALRMAREAAEVRRRWLNELALLDETAKGAWPPPPEGP